MKKAARNVARKTVQAIFPQIFGIYAEERERFVPAFQAERERFVPVLQVERERFGTALQMERERFGTALQRETEEIRVCFTDGKGETQGGRKTGSTANWK